MPVYVTSEIGALRSVLVHTPGPELYAVTPSTRATYLYDDMIDVRTAGEEHRRFVAILERFTEVHQVTDLLSDVVQDETVREKLWRESMDIISSEPLTREIYELPPDQLVRTLVEGREEPPGALAKKLNESGFLLPPLPNLFFTRDVAMGIGEHVMIGSMRHGVRWSEELIMKAIFSAHPRLTNRGILYDGSTERRINYTLEGGDVHPLRRDLAVIGFSERSSPAAIENLAALLFAESGITDLIVVVMPRENIAIHLDMIFTQVDRELCVVYPPHFIGPERLPILHWRKGKAQMTEMPTLFAALESCGMKMEPVLCGGARRMIQEREQWASGCNFGALRPGLLTSYGRNEATLHEMEKVGFRIVAAADFLEDRVTIAQDERAVITFPGGELVRGGGGPRCMTCPVTRDDPWE